MATLMFMSAKVVWYFSLNLFILQRLGSKFLQIILITHDDCFLGSDSTRAESVSDAQWVKTVTSWSGICCPWQLQLNCFSLYIVWYIQTSTTLKTWLLFLWALPTPFKVWKSSSCLSTISAVHFIKLNCCKSFK